MIVAGAIIGVVAWYWLLPKLGATLIIRRLKRETNQQANHDRKGPQ